MSEYNTLVLKNKTRISVPELQLELGLTYGEAKRHMEVYVRHGLISSQVEGIYSAVNALSFSKRELDESECEMYAEILEEWDLSLLDDMSEAEYGRAERYPTGDDRFKEMLERLAQIGLVHPFDGKYYLSVTPKSMENIRDAYYRAGNSSPVIGLIAYPILMNAIEMEVDPGEVVGLPFISARCKKYITKRYAEYLFCGEKPQKKQKNITAYGDTLLFDVIGSFILLSENYETKEEFNAEAERNAEVIADSPICTELIKETAAKAAHRIKNSYSLEEIYTLKERLAEVDGDDE